MAAAFLGDRGVTRLALKPGVVELLDVLDELRLPRAIATSSSHRTVRHHLAAHDLAGRFDAVVGSGDYAAGKPAPDPFLTAAERLGVEPRRCLALEDSHNGIRAASAAGMMTIMVPDLLEPTEEIRGSARSIARDWSWRRPCRSAGFAATILCHGVSYRAAPPSEAALCGFPANISGNRAGELTNPPAAGSTGPRR